MLDTWFSSALWPFATLGWPEQTAALRAFYPTDVARHGARDHLPLGGADDHDGARVHAARSRSPTSTCTPVIQAPDGRRMSKSLGTGIDPLEEIERSGADAVRFGLLAMSSTQDVRYSAEKIEQGAGGSRTSSSTPRGFVVLGDRRRGASAPRADARRGPLDPLAAGAVRARARARGSRPTTSRTPRSRSTTSSTASSATGTSSWSSRGWASPAAARATLRFVLRETLHARAPGHAVRDRGAVAARARDGEGLLAGVVARPADGAVDRRRRRGGARAGDRARRRRCAAGATQVGRRSRAMRSPRGSRPMATTRSSPRCSRASRASSCASGGEPAVATRRRSRAARSRSSRASTSSAHEAARASASARSSRRRSSALRAKLANEAFVSQRAGRGRRARAREARGARARSCEAL